jgi:hypothetical protein
MRLVHGLIGYDDPVNDSHLPPEALAVPLTDFEEDANLLLNKWLTKYTAEFEKAPDPVAAIYATLPEPRGGPKLTLKQFTEQFDRNPRATIDGNAMRLALEKIGTSHSQALASLSQRRADRASAIGTHRSLHVRRTMVGPNGSSETHSTDLSSHAHQASHRALGFAEPPGNDWSLYRAHEHRAGGEIIWVPHPSPKRPDTTEALSEIEALKARLAALESKGG